MRLPVASAVWMANSATSVLPDPVGADTMTDCPASIARIASSWKSSSGNGYRARNGSSSSITRHSTTAVEAVRERYYPSARSVIYSPRGGIMATKRRTSILLDEALLKKARKTLRASTNTEAITRALQEALVNQEIEATLRNLIRKGRGRFVDVDR